MSRAVDRAYATIRAAILASEFESGDSLREEELADRTGVSRTPVREALRKLAAEGFVQILPNRGARVATWSLADVREIFGLRAVLEAHCAGLAANNATTGQISELRDLADGMLRLLGDGSERIDQIAILNNQFHEAILKASGNVRAQILVTGLIQTALVHRTYRVYGADILHRQLAHHNELADAIAARNPQWAKSVMTAHVIGAEAEIVRSMQDMPSDKGDESAPSADQDGPTSADMDDNEMLHAADPSADG